MNMGNLMSKAWSQKEKNLCPMRSFLQETYFDYFHVDLLEGKVKQRPFISQPKRLQSRPPTL